MMADVRSLLRSERIQRRIDHPHANYSSTGTLQCSVCNIPLKSDIEVWNKHMKSTQHAMRQERLRLSTFEVHQRQPEQSRVTKAVVPAREMSSGNKKRKVDDDGDDSRKKTKMFPDVVGASDETTQAMIAQPQPQVTHIGNSKQTSTATSELKQLRRRPVEASNIDEDEWAAFERDVATPPPDTSLPSALTATATISAAPLTAAEIAAQSREQASLQNKERREAEVEGEKEDAARALEEEFDEMEGLGERVQRLREKREKLRLQIAKEAEAQVREASHLSEQGQVGSGVESEDDEDDENDDWGPWGR